MIQDESQAERQPFLQQGQPQPQQQQNPLGGLTQAAPQMKMTKAQLIAGLHHLSAFQKQFSPLLKNPITGKSNIRPKIFDAAATLIGEQIFSVPEVINGIKDLPDDPVDQKKWLELKLSNAAQAEQKLISDYIAQGPGQEDQGPEWSKDTHKDHMAGLLGNYKRG